MIYLLPYISDGIQLILNFVTVYLTSLILIFSTFLVSGFLFGFLNFNYIKR